MTCVCLRIAWVSQMVSDGIKKVMRSQLNVGLAGAANAASRRNWGETRRQR